MTKKRELRHLINLYRGELAQARLEKHILTNQFEQNKKGIQAEWMAVVDVLSKIVPHIPLESTLEMVERVKAKLAESEDWANQYHLQVVRLEREEHWNNCIRKAAEANGWNLMDAPLDQWIIAHLMAPTPGRP